MSEQEVHSARPGEDHAPQRIPDGYEFHSISYTRHLDGSLAVYYTERIGTESDLTVIRLAQPGKASPGLDRWLTALQDAAAELEHTPGTTREARS